MLWYFKEMKVVLGQLSHGELVGNVISRGSTECHVMSKFHVVSWDVYFRVSTY